MIVCPNCNHQNPDGAVQCEACYTPLPATTSCPNCGTSVQTDASFCGQCGFDLRASAGVPAPEQTVAPTIQVSLPDLVIPDPLIAPEPVVMKAMASTPENGSENANASPPSPTPVPPPPLPEQPQATEAPAISANSTPPPFSGSSKTQLQQQTARLLHVQTQTLIELPQNLSVIHVGKPNDQIPPDIDVSGFPNSEIVSRVHADVRVEGDTYYIEDVGSANGTYINHSPLPMGNRHRLRPGDRISLGKGDLVTFLFQLS